VKRDRFIKINLTRKAKPEKKAKPRVKPSIKIPEKLTGNFIVIGALIIALIISAIVDGRQIVRLGELQKEKAKKEQELKKLNRYYARMKELEKKLTVVKKKLEIISKISRESKVPLRIMESLEECILPEVWITKLSWTEKKMKIQGYTLNEDRLADFIEKMEKKPFVGKIFVSYIKRKVIKSVTAKEFNLEVNLL